MKHTSCLAIFFILLFDPFFHDDGCQADSASDSVDRPQTRPDVRLVLKQTEKTIAVVLDGTSVLVYNKQSPELPESLDSAYHRSGFLHPVSSPAGHVVTALFPLDHPHQDGVFSAWVNTSWNDRKIDFWNLAGGTGRVLHQKVVDVFCDETSAGFEVDLVHRIVEPPAADVLVERWKVTVWPTENSWHCFDLETTQSALTDVPLIINEYHYGGIALRGPTQWLQPTNKNAGNDDKPTEASDFLNDQGSGRIHGNHQKSRWVSLTGSLDRQPVSISVLCHAQNFRAPQSARLHPTKPYFCFAPCVEGEFIIDREHPFHARYRYLITDAPPDAAWLDQQWSDWCGE